MLYRVIENDILIIVYPFEGVCIISEQVNLPKRYVDHAVFCWLYRLYRSLGSLVFSGGCVVEII